MGEMMSNGGLQDAVAQVRQAFMGALGKLTYSDAVSASAAFILLHPLPS